MEVMVSGHSDAGTAGAMMDAGANGGRISTGRYVRGGGGGTQVVSSRAGK